MGEAPGVLSVVDLTGSLKGLVAHATGYWAARSERVIHFSWQRHPRAGSPIEISQTSARVWVCREDGRPVRERPDVGPTDEVPLKPLADGSYVWDEGGRPMVLLVLPSGTPLAGANPPPSGVWESEGRICAFWQAPTDERKIVFRPGAPDGPISGNAESWQGRVSGLQLPRSRSHPIAVSIAILVAAVVAAVVLGVFYGQATAAAWIGTGGTVISLANTFILPQLRSKPDDGGSYSA
jgi:hypothetical protein